MKNPNHVVFSGGTFGLMSGEAPKFTASVDATHENLVGTLRQMGLKFEQTDGKYEVPEKSVIIHQPRLDQMKTLGKLFGQESIVHSVGGRHELHYTNGPFEGKVRRLDPAQVPHQWFPEAPEDYFTRLPNGGHFRINFNFKQDPE